MANGVNVRERTSSCLRPPRAKAPSICELPLHSVTHADATRDAASLFFLCTAALNLPLLLAWAVFLLIGAVFAFLPGIKVDTPNTVALYSVIGSVVLIIADIGRRRSRPSLLRLYAVLSSLAMLLFTISLANQYSLVKAVQYISSGGARKFDANDFPSFQIGFLVYILTLSLFKITTIKAVVFLLFNMTPPKKAS